MNDSLENKCLVEKNPLGLQMLAEEFRTDRRSPVEYLEGLKRRFEQREPHVRAFVHEPPIDFQRMGSELKQLQASYPHPESRPPLYAIPVGIKDIFHVDGLPTRGGSRLPPEAIGGPEAAAVGKLKAAGAVIMGKTVTVEFANYAPGPTCNPHHPGHTPGGSSSGSAAAVAAGLCPLTLGTQTVGSVIRPAAYCGVVGFKPSYGRIPIEGVIPMAPSLDHVGFFTSDLDGGILAAEVLVEDWNPRPDRKPLICGIPHDAYLKRADEETLNRYQRTCKNLKRVGVGIRQTDALKNLDEIVEKNDRLCDAEFAYVHAQWYGAYADLYSEGNKEAILRGKAVNSDALEDCRDHRETTRAQLVSIMKQENLTAFMAPAATGPAPEGLLSTGDWVMNLPWTHSGLPVVTLPAGLSETLLPLGIQFIGGWMMDERLLYDLKRLSDSIPQLFS